MGAYIYAPKSKTPETAKLTPLAEQILRVAAARSGASKSNVIEHLLRTRGQEIAADAFVPVEDDAVAACAAQ